MLARVQRLFAPKAHCVQGATSVLFFEARKRSDLYLWVAKAPGGPSVRFLCSNVHTMAELKLSGNHLKGSRPVVAFDAAFDEQPQLQACSFMLSVTRSPAYHGAQRTLALLLIAAFASQCFELLFGPSKVCKQYTSGKIEASELCMHVVGPHLSRWRGPHTFTF
jgi:ribosome biogenesis protein BRX1